MNRQTIRGMFIIALLLVWGAGITLAQGTAPGSPLAAVGSAFTYQGYLEKSGSPLDSTCDFRFSLWDAASGGSQIGTTQEVSGVTVEDGYFTVSGLDFGAAAFAGEARYLEIALQCTGDSGYTALGGRVELKAAPYAMYAMAAPWSGLSGVPGGFADGVDDDTTYTAGTGLDLTGTQFGITPAYRLPQSCADGQIAEWDSASGAWACGDDDTGSGSSSAWSLTGNAGTNPSANFLGTTDFTTLNLKVNNTAALRLEPGRDSPCIVGGYSGNAVGVMTEGAVVCGGGAANSVNSALGDYSVVGGGHSNEASGDGSVVSGGEINKARRGDATVGGGIGNIADATQATVGGGDFNTASGDKSTIGGGSHNRATMTATVIGGGYSNEVAAAYGTIAGGYNITVTGEYAAVAGGINNEATGEGASVPGGHNNSAQGLDSFAAGHHATALHDGSFVWSDSRGEATSQRSNQFLVQAYGGARFQDGGGMWIEMVYATDKPIDTSTGAYLSSGGTWTDSSDRNLKENFEPVDAEALLQQVAQLPVTTWNYKAEDDSVRHMGPVAQDFYAAFGLGADDRHIAALDSSGVALAAIQGLYAQVQTLEAENAALKAENAAQQARLDDLEARMEALEANPPLFPTDSTFAPQGSGVALALLFGAVAFLVGRRAQRRDGR